MVDHHKNYNYMIQSKRGEGEERRQNGQTRGKTYRSSKTQTYGQHYSRGVEYTQLIQELVMSDLPGWSASFTKLL